MGVCVCVCVCVCERVCVCVYVCIAKTTLNTQNVLSLNLTNSRTNRLRSAWKG